MLSVIPDISFEFMNLISFSVLPKNIQRHKEGVSIGQRLKDKAHE